MTIAVDCHVGRVNRSFDSSYPLDFLDGLSFRRIERVSCVD